MQNGWLLTGDLGTVDEDRYVSFVGRKDDVISSGYRISPYETKDMLTKHTTIDEVAVVGVPDDERGEITKTFIVFAGESEPTDQLREDLQSFVKNTRAKYEYPREIAFVDSVPKTATGKIQRTASASGAGRSVRDRHCLFCDLSRKLTDFLQASWPGCLYLSIGQVYECVCECISGLVTVFRVGILLRVVTEPIFGD